LQQRLIVLVTALPYSILDTALTKLVFLAKSFLIYYNTLRNTSNRQNSLCLYYAYLPISSLVIIYIVKRYIEAIVFCTKLDTILTKLVFLAKSFLIYYNTLRNTSNKQNSLCLYSTYLPASSLVIICIVRRYIEAIVFSA